MHYRTPQRDTCRTVGKRRVKRPLTDEEEADWEDWWDTVVEMWEDRVRHQLKNTEELTLAAEATLGILNDLRQHVQPDPYESDDS